MRPRKACWPGEIVANLISFDLHLARGAFLLYGDYAIDRCCLRIIILILISSFAFKF